MGKLGLRILVHLKQMERNEEGAIKKAQSYAPSTHILSLSRETIYFPWHHTSGIAGCFVAHTRTHARARHTHRRLDTDCESSSP